MKQKKSAMRRCIGCFESKPKKELLRIVRATDGNIVLDPTGKQNGRGAYLCSNIECFEKMVKGNKLSKEFETPVLRETYEALANQFELLTRADDSKSGGGTIE